MNKILRFCQIPSNTVKYRKIVRTNRDSFSIKTQIKNDYKIKNSSKRVLNFSI